MSAESYPGLIDELARSRAAAVPAPVTLSDCQRVLATLKDKGAVHGALIIACMEFLLSGQREGGVR